MIDWWCNSVVKMGNADCGSHQLSRRSSRVFFLHLFSLSFIRTFNEGQAGRLIGLPGAVCPTSVLGPFFTQHLLFFLLSYQNGHCSPRSSALPAFYYARPIKCSPACILLYGHYTSCSKRLITVYDCPPGVRFCCAPKARLTDGASVFLTNHRSPSPLPSWFFFLLGSAAFFIPSMSFTKWKITVCHNLAVQ